MGYKLLVHEFFENKKVILRFIIIFTVFFSIISFLVIKANNDITTSVSQPDFVFRGTIYNSEDGKYPFIAYNDMGLGFAEEVNDICKDEAIVYNAVCRSLYNYYDEFTGIGFSGYVYGFSDSYITNNLAQYISKGRLPQRGEKEALVGAYFAERFGLSVGDTIPQAITLSKEWDDSDINNYIVCGILNENVADLYVGSAIISRETYTEKNQQVEDNYLIGYFSGNDEQLNREIFLNINQISSDYIVPEGNYYYARKGFAQNQVYFASGVMFIVGFVMVSILIAYIMKGIDRKIGLLKAIGVSTKTLMKYFVGGFCTVIGFAVILATVVVALLTQILNQYISNFYHFKVHIYTINVAVLWLVLFVYVSMVGIMYALIRHRCIGVSPQKAMTTR